MTVTDQQPSNILDHFFNLFDPDEWFLGLDLYQNGHVTSLKQVHGLVVATVDDTEAHKPDQVRIKIHPNARTIQWIECTCRKNRQTGSYCEHISAVVIHVDRESPKLFQQLDLKMPIKALASQRRQTNKARIAETATSAAHPDATASIVNHLKGSIKSMRLVGGGPNLQVNVDMKNGQATTYQLDIDSAAAFLKANKTHPMVQEKLGHLQVFKELAELGTRICPSGDEKITIERVVAIQSKNHSFDPVKGLEQGQYQKVMFKSNQLEKGKPSGYLFKSYKKSAKYLGKDFFYIPKVGYFPISKKQTLQTWNDLPFAKALKDDSAAEFLTEGVKEYLRCSPVWFEDSLADTEVIEGADFTKIDLMIESKGWFYLDPRYGEGDDAISMATLIRQYQSKKRKYYRSGKKWMKLPDFVTDFDWEIDDEKDLVKVDTLGLLRFKAKVGEFDGFGGNKAALSAIRNRLEFEKDKAIIPKSCQKNLREYQVDGLKWIWWLYKNDLHGLLADEMGLGKTHQVMAFFRAIQCKEPNKKFLVVAPTTVLEHWYDKIVEYYPELIATKYHGPKRIRLLNDFKASSQVLITSYGVLFRDIKQLREIEWEAVVLDEAHFVKNNSTATYRAACRLPSKFRLGLSGTPFENHLGELKNIFDFLLPGYLGSDQYFRKQYRSKVESGEHPEQVLALQKLIHPFKLRRTKDQVVKDLPEKVIDLRHCNLSTQQSKLYKGIVNQKVSPLIETLSESDGKIPYLHVFAVLNLLKQVCNHPALLYDPKNYRTHESGKFELLKELFEEALGSGHKIVLFSQYLGMIEIISDYLKSIATDHVVLTGSTQNRGAVIKKFQTDPNCKVFCGSLMAGGIGIDLTAASVVIHYDRWWNASKENQATDRVHRIGQKRNVLVYKLQTRGTLEEKIDAMIKKKQNIFAKFVDYDEEIFKTLSRQELIELLT